MRRLLFVVLLTAFATAAPGQQEAKNPAQQQEAKNPAQQQEAKNPAQQQEAKNPAQQQETKTQQQPKSAAGGRTANLPDFTALMKQQGPAVVNVITKREAKAARGQQGQGQQAP